MVAGSLDGREPAPTDSEVDPGSPAVPDGAIRAQDREGEPPAGQATGAGGGYGVGSGTSSGGSGEPTEPAAGEADPDGSTGPTSAEDQTEWLREAPGGPTEGESEAQD